MKIIKSMLLSASLLSVAATAHDHHEADSPDHRHNAPASALYLGQDPTRIILGQVTADMVRIPHSGWPERMTDVENMAYRVTLNPGSNQARTVLHIGDADTRDQHYAVNAEHWASPAYSHGLSAILVFHVADGSPGAGPATQAD